LKETCGENKHLDLEPFFEKGFKRRFIEKGKNGAPRLAKEAMSRARHHFFLQNYIRAHE